MAFHTRANKGVTSGSETGNWNNLESLLNVGDVMSLESNGKKYNTIFRGIKPPVRTLVDVSGAALSGGQALQGEMHDQGYLLLDAPVRDGKHVMLEFNAPVTMRFIVEGVVYGFRSYFCRFHGKIGIIAVEYPAVLEKFSLRAHRRLSTVMRTEVFKAVGGKHQGVTIDLSPKGARFGLKNDPGFTRGDDITFSVTLTDGTVIGGVPAEVRNSLKDGERFFYGISFGQAPSGALESISNFYEHCAGGAI